MEGVYNPTVKKFYEKTLTNKVNTIKIQMNSLSYFLIFYHPLVHLTQLIPSDALKSIRNENEVAKPFYRYLFMRVASISFVPTDKRK